MQDVSVINIRTNEIVVSNKDGHFMISGRVGDELRFVKVGYERMVKKVSPENTQSPLNVSLISEIINIPEVTVKQGITGNLKVDSKNLDRPKKVEKLVKELKRYIAQKSDPKLMAHKPGEFVQPRGPGFSIGSVKDQWDDIDFMEYLRESLGDEYFINLQIEKPQIDHFIRYIFATGFDRKKILKYGFCSNEDMNRFQRYVLVKITSYRASKTQR